MWVLHVEYSRRGQLGEGWHVVGQAPDQPRMSWGPYPSQAAAEACRQQLLAHHATPAT